MVNCASRASIIRCAHVRLHDGPGGLGVPGAERFDQLLLIGDPSFAQLRVRPVVDPLADGQLLQQSNQEPADEPEQRVVRKAGKRLVELELGAALLAFFLDGGRWCRVAAHARAQLLHLLRRDSQRQIGDELRLERDSELVDIGDRQILEEQIIGKKRACLILGNLGDERAAAGAGPGPDQALGLQSPERLSHRPLARPEIRDQLMLLGESVAGGEAVLDDPVLDDAGDGQGPTTRTPERSGMGLVSGADDDRRLHGSMVAG